MNNLIKFENGNAILAPEAVNDIANFERALKEIKAKEDALKKSILEAMEYHGVLKIESDDMVISYVAETTRESLDSKALKTELPEIYDTYAKISPVKASIRIKLR